MQTKDVKVARKPVHHQELPENIWKRIMPGGLFSPLFYEKWTVGAVLSLGWILDLVNLQHSFLNDEGLSISLDLLAEHLYK